MSFKDTLQKAVPVVATAAAMMGGEVKADQNTGTEPAVPQTRQVANEQWQWGNSPEAMRDRAVYESLPAEYKAFAHKSFMQRMEIQEEWEQKDFIKRDRKRSEILKKNPNATIGDYHPGASTPDLPLSDYPTGEGRFSDHIIQDQINGRLSPEQVRVAEELVALGRPLSTIDTSLPYPEQLRSCGFEKVADVAAGQREHSMNPRDRSIYIAEYRDAKMLDSIGQNEQAVGELWRRLQKEDNEDYAASHGFLSRLMMTKTKVLHEGEFTPAQFEKINGKDVMVPNPKNITYSVRDEVTRKVADKIAKEEAATQARQTAARAAQR